MADVGGKLVILKRRAEFLRCRAGLRWASPGFVIEAKQRPISARGSQAGWVGPRFGFTVTKKLGNAVRRNRIRRRLKAVVKSVAPTTTLDGFDYVIIARSGAETFLFATLEAEFAKAFGRVHQPGAQHGAKSRSNRAPPATRA